MTKHQPPREGFDSYTRLIAGSWQEAVNAEPWVEKLLLLEIVWLTTAAIPAFITTILIQLAVGPVPFSGFVLLAVSWGIAFYSFAWWYPDVQREHLDQGSDS